MENIGDGLQEGAGIDRAIADPDFARRLYAEEHVTVLPGSFLARTAGEVNPGANYVRIALVADTAECLEAVERLAAFARRL